MVPNYAPAPGKMKKAVCARLLSRLGLRSLVSRFPTWSGVIVLNYHRVGDGANSHFDRDIWSADARGFAEQVRFCKSHMDIIQPADLPQAITCSRGRYCLITFDDGYRDNYETAFPILRAERVPATFFVTVGFIDAPKMAWWDEIAWMVRASRHGSIDLRPWIEAPVPLDKPSCEHAVRTFLRAYKTLPSDSTQAYLDALAKESGSGRCSPTTAQELWMSWDMLREMCAGGMTVGGHTVNHPILARAGRAQQREEILGCKRRLAEELGVEMKYFSYPVGGLSTFDSVTRECLREAGVDYAFSYYGGFRRFRHWDNYDVRRVPVETYIGTDWFRCILSLPTLFA